MRLKRFVDDLFTVLKYPVLVALFGIDAFVLIPVTVMMIPMIGIAGVGVVLAGQLPAIFFIAREAYRRAKLKSMTDKWETSPEKWAETLDAYVKEANESRKKERS